MDFRTLLDTKEFILLDGATGTMIQKSGAKYDHSPETLNITSPELIASFHRAYIDAGADVVYTNTFGANSYKLGGSGHSVEEVISAAVGIAKNAAKGKALVALDIGPVGMLCEPAGTMTFEQAYGFFKEQIEAGCDADLIVFETMTDLLELKAALLAAKENSDKPVIATMTFERDGRTFTGVSPAAFALTASGLGVDALGVNCSLGPDELEPVVAELTKYTDLPLVVKANAGLPDPNSNEYNILPDRFAECVEALLPYGVKIAGGCCGTTPEYIGKLREMLADKRYTPSPRTADTSVCSASRVVEINAPRIIGERINPTGKKIFKQALVDNNIDYILSQALVQLKGGAELLDVNVGHPEIDEKSMMVRVVKAIQSVCDAPLQIDSTKPGVLDAGLRCYSGKPIVNSVNGEEKSLSEVLPLVKKYGAAVVGLTLDENGIPKTADGRFEIAKRIVERAEALGIDRRDVYIDCLTLTVSAEQEACRQTLEALHRVKTELGCKTVLGVSNISFGLPNRGLVNSTFLTMALEQGLDLPILNPNIEVMSGAVRAFRVLSGYDKNANDFVAAYNDAPSAQPAAKPQNGETDLFTAVYSGLKNEGAAATEKLLETEDAMAIVNGKLIPALDRVGADFENKKIFLPQLIQSANTAQACFEVIKKHLAKSGGAGVSKGKIILATVKGDIHDIGKNIVKTLLDNYGYTVIDLGRDVDPQLVVDTAVEQNITMVGLSALMTTTLKSMEDTITLIRQTKALQNPDGTSKVRVFVGGAVLTADYAMKIGADYYCRDAKESVDTAKLVFGE
ncbi:MAG: homocysteine S-methyltransferase family protein [Eubacteriales bacterium]|nr:homocysteine S-methyltransferase family protein [Eubacteriales bacterium]